MPKLTIRFPKKMTVGQALEDVMAAVGREGVEGKYITTGKGEDVDVKKGKKLNFKVKKAKQAV